MSTLPIQCDGEWLIHNKTVAEAPRERTDHRTSQAKGSTVSNPLGKQEPQEIGTMWQQAENGPNGRLRARKQDFLIKKLLQDFNSRFSKICRRIGELKETNGVYVRSGAEPNKEEANSRRNSIHVSSICKSRREACRRNNQINKSWKLR